MPSQSFPSWIAGENQLRTPHLFWWRQVNRSNQFPAVGAGFSTGAQARAIEAFRRVPFLELCQTVL
jgi:hypothetical protein